MAEQLTLTDYIIVAILGLAGIQIISFIVSALFPEVRLLKLGAAFTVLLVGVAVVIAFSVAKGISAGKILKDNRLSLIIATAIVIGLLFMLPDLIPSIFDAQAFVETFSILG